MKTTFYFYSQINLNSPSFDGDSLKDFFPNGRDINIVSKKYDTSKECIDACNEFIFSKITKLNETGKNLMVVWDANPEYATAENKNIGKSTKKWMDNELLKYYVLRKEDSKNSIQIESPFITTILIHKEADSSTISSSNSSIN